MDSRYILKAEMEILADRSNVGYKKKREKLILTPSCGGLASRRSRMRIKFRGYQFIDNI